MDQLPANRMRVLVVEDDHVTARDLEATLRRRGFLVSGPVRTADDALRVAEEESPQLALLDIQLANADDGIRLASQLRESRDLPVVFITGFSEEALFERASEAKPVGFLRKPFSEAELVVCLESVFERGIAGEGLAKRLPGIEAVSEALPHAVIVSDLGGEVRYLNPAAERLTGWSRSDAIGHPLGKVAPLEDSEESGMASGTNGPGLRRLVLSGSRGTRAEVEERTSPVKTAEGEVVGLITIFAEQPTAASSFQPPVVPPLAPLPKSPAVPLAEDTTATEPSDGFLPPARAGALRKIAEISRDPAFREMISKRPDRDVAAKTDPPAPEASPPPASPSPALEAELPFDDVGDPLVKIDETGVVLYANAEAANVFGDGAHIAGREFAALFAGADMARYDEAFRRPLADGLRHRFDFHDTKRGVWFEVRAYRTGDGVLALFTDITKRKLESAESIRQQRLEGLGLLARGFAHDFNNHLTTITGNISLARERQQEDAEVQQMLNEAQVAASRATGLVQQLMTFAQGGRPIRKETRIADLIRRILNEQRLRHPDIRYQFQNPDTDLVANVDPAQIGRLVENLVANSADAMSGGGVLILRCGTIPPEKVRELKESHDPIDENYLVLEVIDTGHGMSESSLGRVFEPYFTTREADNATGIGLTVCESIAKAHGGFVQLQSKEGKGTIATFCAPLGHVLAPDAVGFTTSESEILSPPPLQTGPRFTPVSEDRGESGSLLVGTRILILEDDAPIRRLMAATLRRAGHEVVETKDGRETIALYREAMEQGAKFHLLICDLTIENGVGGVETMRQLTQYDPSILAIVSSGYSDAPAMSSPASFGFSGVLPKPYAPSELRAAVHRILSAHHIIP